VQTDWLGLQEFHMLGSSSNNNRWKHQVKPGQVVACRIINTGEGGYHIEFGNKLRGFVTTTAALAIGAETLMQFVGYKNQLAIFNIGFGSGMGRN
jgi:hypothetical protein